jgi:hypothetical protein
MSQFNISNPNYGFSGTQLVDGGFALRTQPSEKTSDNFGRQKVTIHQNVYEADFEYGPQILRWESLTFGSASIQQIPSLGGISMVVGTGSNDIAIRQSRPYHRYQPGKTMYMSANANFGAPVQSNFQRVGFFDDQNGAFFEQGVTSSLNPYGMYVCLRSDASLTGSLPVDTRVPLNAFNGDILTARSVDWTKIQMIWIEYAWYGAGTVRFGVTLNSEQYVLHTFNTANSGTFPWARTGNLPVRYEVRNSGSAALPVTAPTTFYHFGVSVVVEGGRDSQRGFTYSYGINPSTPRGRTVPAGVIRYPVLSVQNRPMGTIEYTNASAAIATATTASITVSGTPWTTNQWLGKCIYFPTGSQTARIVSNTNNTVNFVDVVTGLQMTSSAQPANSPYTIGLVNRGQILPLSLVISTDQLCTVELIESAPNNPIILTGSNFVPMSSLGSANSFATRDISATGMNSGSGEVVYAFVAPAGGSGLQVFDLSNFFPLYNTIRGNVPDILTVAVTTSTTGSSVGCHIVAQEAMS